MKQVSRDEPLFYSDYFISETRKAILRHLLRKCNFVCKAIIYFSTRAIVSNPPLLIACFNLHSTVLPPHQMTRTGFSALL